MITQEDVKQALNYSPDTGIFTFAERPISLFKNERSFNMWNTRFLNKIAGSFNDQGYVLIHVNGNRYRAHRLAWLYVHGSWPENDIDHVDGDRSNNKIENLRDATRGENLQNLRNAKSTNKSSGLLGVGKHKNGKFRAKIQINGVSKHLGYFKTKDEASNAYILEKRAMHKFCSI